MAMSTSTLPAFIRATSSLLIKVGALAPGTSTAPITRSASSTARSTSYALTNVTLPYALSLADKGWRNALRADPALGLGLNTYGGELTYAPVAQAHGLPHRPLTEVLG